MVFLFESDISEGMKGWVSLKFSLDIVLVELFLLLLCEYAAFTFFLFWMNLCCFYFVIPFMGFGYFT
jgi:hypothetical protein